MGLKRWLRHLLKAGKVFGARQEEAEGEILCRSVSSVGLCSSRPETSTALCSQVRSAPSYDEPADLPDGLFCEFSV
jgi:hypothetical protein